MRFRVRQPQFVLSQLEQLNKDDQRFAGHLDLTRVAIIGHGFGGAVVGWIKRELGRRRGGNCAIGKPISHEDILSAFVRLEFSQLIRLRLTTSVTPLP